MRLSLNPSSIADYQRFLEVKSLPKFRFQGRTAIFPDEYAAQLGMKQRRQGSSAYQPVDELFDYQGDISAMAITKRKFAVFADCGLGKTLIMLEFARHALHQLPAKKSVLIISPLMVIPQTIGEAQKFYGDRLTLQQVRSHELSEWLKSGTGIGITNYEAVHDGLPQGKLGALILDESSMLKSHYGNWGRACIRLGRGLRWKLALTGTPAPNDRIEYANHAVFLDAFPTVNSFLARFFVNRGQTDNRWELKPHALQPFYRALSHWCIFLNNPATYGWKDNCEAIPPIHVHMHDVPLTPVQRTALHSETGQLFTTSAGGITTRSAMARIAKGFHPKTKLRIDTNKPKFIRSLIESWPDESTIAWCLYNDEQDQIAEVLSGIAGGVGNITGDTQIDERQRIIESFKRGEIRTLISKPKILGFGLNLQIATRQVFSGLQDSYESYYQAVKRSNRYGAKRPLNVHIPLTELERPMVETVLAKARRVQRDTEEQEAIFAAR